MKKQKAKTDTQDNVGLSVELMRAHRKAKAAAAGQTIEQAKAAFLKHWGRAVVAIETILQAEGPGPCEIITPRIAHLLSLVRPLIRTHPPAGLFVFEAAQGLARDIVALAQDNPPAWLVERAAMEFDAPWLMVNGNPAPGFPESWGHTVTKRGKNRFDAPQTRDVARAVQHRHFMRRYFGKLTPKELKAELKNCEPRLAAELREIAALPPLSRDTQSQWWPSIRAYIRRNAKLTAKEKSALWETVKYETDAGAMNEHLKRCKMAFNGLCPAGSLG